MVSSFLTCANPPESKTRIRGMLLEFFYFNVLFHQNEFLKVLIDEKTISDLLLNINVRPNTH